jgi:biotin operon repressor
MTSWALIIQHATDNIAPLLFFSGELMSIRRILRSLDLDLTPSEKMIMVLLSDNANDETGECWPSQGYLAKRSGLSRQTVNKTIKKLADSGYIKVDNRVGGGAKISNVYTVMCDNQVSNNLTGVSTEFTGGVKLSDIESVIEPVKNHAPETIWTVWDKVAGDNARPVIGRLIKQFGEHEVAKAIGVVMLKQPADPKAYIYGVLNNSKKQRKGFQA